MSRNTGENQRITNLKARIATNSAVTSKKVKICGRRLLFCSNLRDATELSNYTT